MKINDKTFMGTKIREINKCLGEIREQRLAELLQEFVDISFFDKSDPEREKIVKLKMEAKKVLGNQ